MKLTSCLYALAALYLLVTLVGLPRPALAEGNPAVGATIAKRCVACHTLEKGEPNKVGPNLSGIVGRKPGAISGFMYSPSYPAMAAKGIVWDEQALFAYLFDPQKFVKEKTADATAKSRMTFVLKSEQERNDVIAYLKTK